MSALVGIPSHGSHTQRKEYKNNKLLKCLLGAGKNISINLCMIETDIPPLLSIIAERNYWFIKLNQVHVDI